MIFIIILTVDACFALCFRLWSIHTGPPKRVEEMDPNTREYWYTLRRDNVRQRNLARKGVKFYTPPSKHELKFTSRIQPNKAKAKS